MSKRTRTVETLTIETMSRISIAQRNGMAAAHAVEAGIRPDLMRLLELEAENERLKKAAGGGDGSN